MTRLLQQAFETLARMPPESQDEVARGLLGLAGEGSLSDIEPEHEAAVMDGLAQVQRGECSALSPAAAVSAAFDRHRR